MPDLKALPGSRRSVLRTGLAVIAATGAAGLATRAHADSKVAPSSVQYITKPKDGHQCDGCKQFVAPGSCKVVSGPISPNGWCMLYAAKSA